MYWIEKLYIACRKSDKLVFITPFGTDKAFDGRKATGDKWAGVDRDEIFMDNKFETGYKLLAVTSRYSTDNKVWNIQSPHGFEFQIQSENLDHILDNSDIVGRMIKSPCAFSRKNNTNYLVVENSKEHKSLEYRRDVPKIKKPKIGHKYDTSMGEVIYLGKLTHWYISHRETLESSDYGDPYSWNIKNNTLVRPEYYVDFGWQDLSISDILDKHPLLNGEAAIGYTDPKVKLEVVSYPTPITINNYYGTYTSYCIRV